MGFKKNSGSQKTQVFEKTQLFRFFWLTYLWLPKLRVPRTLSFLIVAIYNTIYCQKKIPLGQAFFLSTWTKTQVRSKLRFLPKLRVFFQKLRVFRPKSGLFWSYLLEVWLKSVEFYRNCWKILKRLREKPTKLRFSEKLQLPGNQKSAQKKSLCNYYCPWRIHIPYSRSIQRYLYL